MPTIEVIGSYRIELHPGRERKLPHVHVVHDGSDVLVNLLTLGTYGYIPFRVPKEVRAFLRENQEQLLKAWDQFYA